VGGLCGWAVRGCFVRGFYEGFGGKIVGKIVDLGIHSIGVG
jgi:hypothetical protein